MTSIWMNASFSNVVTDNTTYRQTSNTIRTLVGDKSMATQM